MKLKLIQRPDCSDSRESCDSPGCQTCCPHDEHDHGICLDCGLNQLEDLAAQAYDRAKYARQDA